MPKGSIRDLLIREAHEGGLMGHFGVQKAYETLHKHFYWPHMKHDVHNFCIRLLIVYYEIDVLLCLDRSVWFLCIVIDD